MHIKKTTDYALRTLMYVACVPADELSNISVISEAFGISRNHLMKVVNQLARLGYLETVRGNGGGIRLGKPASQVNIGTLISDLEPVTNLVDCNDGPCKFIGRCRLSVALRQGGRAFVDEMNQFTLSQLVENQSELKKVVFIR